MQIFDAVEDLVDELQELVRSQFVFGERFLEGSSIDVLHDEEGHRLPVGVHDLPYVGDLDQACMREPDEKADLLCEGPVERARVSLHPFLSRVQNLDREIQFVVVDRAVHLSCAPAAKTFCWDIHWRDLSIRMDQPIPPVGTDSLAHLEVEAMVSLL
jgi:hypothetical protein